MSSSKSAITVAVVSWNTQSLLASCLYALAESADDGLTDVWVLDNASSDGSPDLVRHQFPWVHLIASRNNLGFGRAVNEIAAQTDAPWLVAANADTSVTPGALRMLLAAGERHPEAAVIAPRLILPGGETQHSAYPFPTIPFTLAYLSGATVASRRLAHRWCIGHGFDPEEERDVPWAVGAFLMIRRTAWDQIGGFDAGQWMYAEDVDLGWRLRNAGWTTRYLPHARVFHAESAATVQAWGGERHRKWHAATYAWLLRRRGPVYTKVIAALNVLGFRLRAAMYSVLTPVASRRATEARTRALWAARAHAVGLRARRDLSRLS